jgi:hypothetical protein
VCNVHSWQVTSETRSHLRFTKQHGGAHHITIPDHASLRVGTFAGILTDVATHLQIERRAPVAALFER